MYKGCGNWTYLILKEEEGILFLPTATFCKDMKKSRPDSSWWCKRGQQTQVATREIPI